MIVNLSTEQIRTVDQMRTFVEGAELAEIDHVDLDGAYTLIGRTLERVLYPCLGKADKGVVKRFLEKATGLSRAQITRLVGQHRRTGGLRDHRKKPPARPFSRRYTPPRRRNEEAEFHPGEHFERGARGDDSHSEDCVVPKLMVFREVSLRPLPFRGALFRPF